MAYPNFKQKHIEAALFDPKDFIKYSKFKEKYKGKFPKKWVITYQPRALKYFLRKYRPKKHKVHSSLTVYIYKKIGFVKMTGVGAPHVVTIFEEFIALGGRTFINVGTAGGLHHEGVFLCDKALRDEGTSYHYLKHGDFSFPDKKITEKLGKCIEQKRLKYFRGTTWTIDAPYRETRAEVNHYMKKGISIVEMEASALFAVAQFRKVKIASAFVVSDLLGKKWLPKFHRFDVRQTQNKLIEAALSCLL